MNTLWLGTKFLPVIRAVVLMGTGIIVAKIASTTTRRLSAKRLSAHHAQLTRRVIFYTILALFAVMALHQLGFDLSVLLGAAGIFSVAIGFASQTAASNLISGLFLIGEKPFAVKDVVKIGNTTGEVLSIDLLSIKLRTFDNLFVRIPNETVMKAEVTTLTRFPIRRLDLSIGVAYKEDIARVREERGVPLPRRAISAHPPAARPDPHGAPAEDPPARPFRVDVAVAKKRAPRLDRLPGRPVARPGQPQGCQLVAQQRRLLEAGELGGIDAVGEGGVDDDGHLRASGVDDHLHRGHRSAVGHRLEHAAELFALHVPRSPELHCELHHCGECDPV